MKIIILCLSLLSGISSFAGGNLFNKDLNEEITLVKVGINFLTLNDGLDTTTKAETILECKGETIGSAALTNTALPIGSSFRLNFPLIQTVEKNFFIGNNCFIKVVKTPTEYDSWSFKLNVRIYFSDGQDFEFIFSAEEGNCPYRCNGGVSEAGPFSLRIPIVD